MKHPKTPSRPTGTLYFRMHRLVRSSGVIVAIGSYADCRRVQARRPGTTIEVF